MFQSFLTSRLVLVLCVTSVARFQSTVDTESDVNSQQNNFLLELRKMVDRYGSEIRPPCQEDLQSQSSVVETVSTHSKRLQQLEEQVVMQCRNNNESAVDETRRQNDRMTAALQQVEQSLQHLLNHQLRQEVDNSNVKLNESQQRSGPGKDKKSVTPRISHVLNGIGSVNAIAHLHDRLFVTRHGVAQVSVYNATSFQLQSQLTFPGLGRVLFGLATCSTHNYLYVSDYNGRRMFRIDVSLGGVNSWITWNLTDNYPCALSVNAARNVLVAYESEKKVQEYTPTGTLVREIFDSNYLWQAVELSSGIVAVSQGGPTHHAVSKMSMSKVHWRHRYGNQSGSGTGQMASPCGLTTDIHGFVYVADTKNHRILVLNPSFTDDRQLPLPVNTALRPFSLAMDQSRDRLYVGEDGGYNRVLAFDDVSSVGDLFSD